MSVLILGKYYKCDTTELDLSYKRLTQIPPEIGQLHQLRTLYLCHNQLTQIPFGLLRLPPEIGQLQQLRTLYLCHNQLTQIPFGLLRLPPEIGQLQQLRTLSLFDNQLTQIPPEIGQLQQLRYLYLFNNQLTQIPPEIGQLQQLHNLSLRNNQLTQIPPEIGQLQQLQILDLSNNQLTQIPFGLLRLPPEIGQLQQLRELYLSNNQLTQIPPEIGQLQQLHFLSLSYNQLTQIPPEIGQLQRLRYLYLFNNQLTELPFTIINLRLRNITISNNPLENIYPPITRWIQNIQNRSKTSQNIYQNKQSVHDHNIEKTTNESIINFLTSFKYQKTQNLEILINDLNISTTSKQLLLNYSLEDYIHSVLQMKYSEILEPVLYFIINHEHKEELLKILDQEIIESQGKCLQGRISRTINILNGYHDSVKINISDNEQISNLIINLQNKFNDLSKLKDNFIKEMLERNYNNEIIDEWIKHIDENV